jgi:hypothetical protein
VFWPLRQCGQARMCIVYFTSLLIHHPKTSMLLFSITNK